MSLDLIKVQIEGKIVVLKNVYHSYTIRIIPKVTAHILFIEPVEKCGIGLSESIIKVLDNSLQ